MASGDDGASYIKIVDVGSPVVFGAHHLSGERQVVGAPKYFSPEQATGESVGLASDQFTLGVIGYLLLTGALPFFGATPDQLLTAITTTDPKRVTERSPQVPGVLADIIHRCLSKAPEDRFPIFERWQRILRRSSSWRDEMSWPRMTMIPSMALWTGPSEKQTEPCSLLCHRKS